MRITPLVPNALSNLHRESIKGRVAAMHPQSTHHYPMEPGSTDVRPLLRAKANALPYENTGMTGIGAFPPIHGPGFFPAAWGTLDPAVPLTSRPVMVLGQDQDHISGLSRSIQKRSERYSPTWRNMEALFDQAGIPLEACFFTNFIWGIRVDSKRNTGPSPALAHADFMRGCAALFLEQLQAQRPKMIITLGMIPFQLLSLVSTDMRFMTVGIHDFAQLDARESTTYDVVFDTPDRFSSTVVPICHPSYPQNGTKRQFMSATGVTNEAALLREVHQRCVLSPSI